MWCRGIRGATTVEANTKEAILGAARELLEKIVEANDVHTQDVAGVIFTTTTDLNAEFPAAAARQMGWNDIALMCTHEMAVPDGLPMCLRILLLANTDKPLHEIVHVYIKGAKDLKSRTPWS